MIIQVVSGLRTQGGASKHVGGANRTVIKLAQQLLINPAVNLAGKKVVLLLSGGNIDVTVISKIIERGLAADGRLCRVTCRVTDRPGSLARVATVLAHAGASVKEVDHERDFGPPDINMVNIRFILETRDAQHIQEIAAALKDAGIDADVA